MERNNSSRLPGLALIGIFLAFIAAVGIFVAFREQRTFSEMENRTMASMPKLTAESLLSGDYMADMEDAISDQMVLRSTMIELRSFIARNLARIAYLPTEDEALPIYDQSDKLLWQKESRIIPYSTVRAESEFPRIQARLDEYAAIAEALPEVNICLYELPTYSWLDYMPTAESAVKFVGSDYNDYFLEGLTEDINYDILEMDTVEDYIRYSYKTDHHWNAAGAWQGYLDCCELIGIDGAKHIKPMKLKEMVTLTDSFRGSYAAETAYDTLTDDFTVPVTEEAIDLTCYINGKKLNRGQWHLPAEELTLPSGRFANWYQWYYGITAGLVEYRNNQKQTGVLLIVGGSNTHAVQYLLANHYRKTFVADLRYYAEDMGGEFDIIDFARENKVSDILVLGRGLELYATPFEWGLLPETRAEWRERMGL